MATEIARDQVIDALEFAGMSEDDLRDDYSGRGMYGEVCFGIVHDNQGELLRFVAGLAEQGETLDWIGRATSDGMGLSTITYWPGVTVVD